MTTGALPTEPPRTELDPVEGVAAPDRSVGGRPGEIATIHDDAGAELVALAVRPDEWSDLQLKQELASSSHSRVTWFTTADGRDVVVKAFRVHHGDVQAVWEHWEACRSAGAPLVPIERTSLGPMVAFEQMPYRPDRSLYELMAEGGQFPHPRRSTDDLKAIARQVDEALTALHKTRPDHRYAVHRDVKPGNILVTGLNPPLVELADTETVVLVDPLDTARPLPRRGTLPYEAPEAGYAAHPSMDYWSLGMTLAELGAGRHPFQYSEVNEFFHPEFIHRQLTEGLPEVPAELDPETAALVRGMLVRRGDERFGHPEILRWLAGERLAPPVDEAAAAVRGSAAQPDDEDPAGTAGAVGGQAEDGFVFAGMLLHRRESIAAALAEHWSEAVRTLLGRDFDQLLNWVADHHPELARQFVSLRDRRQAGAIDVHRAVAETIWSLDPESPPSFAGRLLDRAGLSELVRAVIAGDEVAATDLVRLRDSDVLEVLALRPAHQDLQLVMERWRELSAAADRLVQQYLPPGRRVDQTLLAAHLLLAILSQDAVRALARLAATFVNDRTSEVLWFEQLATDRRDNDAVARHAVMVAAGPIAQAADPGVRPEVDALARDFVERALNARAAPPPPRRSWIPFTPAVYAAVAVVLGIVAVQTWALLSHSVTAFALAAVGVAVVCVLSAVRMPLTNFRSLLLLLGIYSLIGAFAGGVLAESIALLDRGDAAGLGAAWWLWGLAELLAVALAVRGRPRAISRRKRKRWTS